MGRHGELFCLLLALEPPQRVEIINKTVWIVSCAMDLAWTLCNIFSIIAPTWHLHGFLDSYDIRTPAFTQFQHHHLYRPKDRE